MLDELKNQFNEYIENSIKENESKLKDQIQKIKVSIIQMKKGFY